LAKIEPRAFDEKGFVYGLLRWSSYSERVKEFANGANVLHLSLEAASAQEITLPPRRLRLQYSQLIEPFLRLTKVLELRNANLRAQRDLLLPKLISGEIDLSRSAVTLPEAAE
jgi:type I restriction enzyme S subunit